MPRNRSRSPVHKAAHHGHSAGNLRSIAAMLLSVCFFSVMDALLKALSSHYPALQITAMRGLTAMPLVLVYVLWRRSHGALWPVRWSLHVLRAALGIASLSLFAFGVRELPLTNAVTLFFIAPLLITLLSSPILGDRVPRAHWWAVVIGMCGVWVALRPSPDGFIGLSSLAVLGAAAGYAVSALSGRLLSRTDSSESMVLSMMVLMTLGALLLAWPQWQPVDMQHAWLLAGLALSGFAGQVAITEAFRHGQASAVAPFEYTALGWGIAFDWLFWHTLPDGYTLLGGAVIIFSGLYLLRHERQHATAEHP